MSLFFVNSASGAIQNTPNVFKKLPPNGPSVNFPQRQRSNLPRQGYGRLQKVTHFFPLSSLERTAASQLFLKMVDGDIPTPIVFAFFPPLK